MRSKADLRQSQYKDIDKRFCSQLIQLKVLTNTSLPTLASFRVPVYNSSVLDKKNGWINVSGQNQQHSILST